MKNTRFRKNLLAALLTLVMVVSLIPTTIFGENVVKAADYQHYNTGHRDTVATELSDAAKAYYEGFAYDYADGVSVTGAELRVALKALMQPSNQVTYSSLPNYWTYTDAEDGKAGTIYFYSDVSSKDVSASLNREHVWPKSHASFQEKNGGADLHHLRPAVDKVNSYRSSYTMGEIDNSKAGSYSFGGRQVGWISNNIFEPLPNVKGDVARIFLYVYTTWGQPNLFQNVSSSKLPAFDSDDTKNDGVKVIESLETLLKWCYDDPVDTWEMQRNDIIEEIQGNRNVFIDYPEYAWLIFGIDVPEGMASPFSGNDTPGTYEPGDLSEYYDDEYKIVINEEDVISLAEANNAASGETITIKGQVAYIYGRGDEATTAAIVDENGDAFNLYFNNNVFSYSIGDIVLAKGSVSEYHGVKQLTEGYASKVVTKAADAPAVVAKEVTLAELNADPNAFVNQYVVVKNVVLGSKDAAEGLLTITQDIDGTVSTIAAKDPASYPAGVAKTDTVDIYCVASRRDAEAQLRIGSSKDYILVKKGQGSQIDLSTADGIISAAFELEAGQSLGQAVTLSGTVQEIKTAYSSQYDNITVNVEFEGETLKKVIQCYRLKGGATLAVGDRITVTGDITNYNGTLEFVAGSTYVSNGTVTPTTAPTGVPTTAPTTAPSVVPTQGVDLTTEEGILAAAFALEKGASLGQAVTLTGEITSIKTAYSSQYNNITVNLKVADKTIQGYRLAGGSELEVGNIIAVTGDITNYNGTIEFVAGSTYVLLGALPTAAPTNVPTTAPTTVPTQKPVEGDTFKKINSVDELEVGTQYIIYGVNHNNNSEQTAYAMGNALSSNRPNGVEVTVVDDTIVNTDTTIVWTIGQDADGNYTLFNEAKGQYLTLKNNSTKPFVFEAAPSSAYTVSAEDGNFTFTGTAVDRIVSIYTKDFRAYVAGGKEIQELNLFKLYVPEYAFQQIDSVDALEDGSYILFGVNGDFNGALNNVCTKNLMGLTPVEFTEDGFIAKDADTSVVWEIKRTEAGRFTIYNAEAGKYLCVVKNDNKGFGLSDTADSTFAIKFMEDGTVRFEAENANRGICIYQNDFRSYKETIFDQFAYQNFLYKLSEVKAQPVVTPVPTATNTPVPTATNTPVPTATNTPTPEPTATNTPVPTATNTPTPTIEIIAPADFVEGGQYVKAAFDDIALGGQFIFVSNGYAMGSTVKSNRPLGVEIAEADGVITEFTNDIIWTLTAQEDGTFTFYNAAIGKYLVLSKDSTKPFELKDEPEYRFTAKEGADGSFLFGTTLEGCQRYLSLYQTDFRAYVEGAKEAQPLYLYMYEAPVVEEPKLDISINIVSAWNDCVQAEVTITNISDELIKSWKADVLSNVEIQQIWSAELLGTIDGGYVIGCPSWKQNLAAGESYSFGFIARKTADEVEFGPADLISEEKETAADYNVSFKKTGEWAYGFNGEIVIANAGNENIVNWTIEFDYADEITNIWNAAIVSHEGNHYVVTNANWNSTIWANGNVSFGFSGTPVDGAYSDAVIENVKMTSVQ